MTNPGDKAPERKHGVNLIVEGIRARILKEDLSKAELEEILRTVVSFKESQPNIPDQPKTALADLIVEIENRLKPLN